MLSSHAEVCGRLPCALWPTIPSCTFAATLLRTFVRLLTLRGYSGEGLAVLSGRRQAYGYRTLERFLRELAAAGGAQTLTDALGQWTTQLWQTQRLRVAGTPPSFYIDSHRKAVYSDVLVPRGLVG